MPSVMSRLMHLQIVANYQNLTIESQSHFIYIFLFVQTTELIGINENINSCSFGKLTNWEVMRVKKLMFWEVEVMGLNNLKWVVVLMGSGPQL